MTYEKFVLPLKNAWPLGLIWDALTAPELPVHIEVFHISKEGTMCYPDKGFEIKDEKAKSFLKNKVMQISPGPFYLTEDNRTILHSRPMYHPHDELFILVGTDPENPTDLGGEFHIWLGLGERAEKQVIKEPSVIWIPRGLVHGPFVDKPIRRPFMLIVIALYPYLVEHGVNEWPPDFKPEEPKREYVDLRKVKVIGPKPTDPRTFCRL
ncbi:MAG: hypothetical protein QXU81_07575 [Candidatus Bathyarchaeia archaeon]